jgi:hypothetical protein
MILSLYNSIITGNHYVSNTHLLELSRMSRASDGCSPMNRHRNVLTWAPTLAEVNLTSDYKLSTSLNQFNVIIIDKDVASTKSDHVDNVDMGGLRI